jgi:hypothetical protein
MIKVKAEHAAGVVLLGGAVLFLWGGLKKAGGAAVPAVATTESAWNVPEPVQAILCMPDEHIGGGDIVFSKHRYPDRVGGNLTTVIHYGHSALSVPHVTDWQWIVNPPSELTL